MNSSKVLLVRRVFYLLILVSAGLVGSSYTQEASNKVRVIVTTDGEVDDRCSMTRFLLYANEFEVKGLVHSSSKHHWKGDGKHPGRKWVPVSWLDERLDAYAKVYENLKLHDAAYPSPEYLRSQVFVGNIVYEGDMAKPTPGSDHIAEVLLEKDMSPVWLQAWGGSNTIARALKTIQEKHPDRVAEVSKKSRIFLISQQDNTYKTYIEREWPKIQTLQSSGKSYGAIAYRWKSVQPKSIREYFDSDWMRSHILKGHGPLNALYETNKDGSFLSEGDSPAFLHLIPTGLGNGTQPAFGGWGGRFRPHTDFRWKSVNERKGDAHSILRWAKDFQNDWAARADWCVLPVAEANHPPVVRISEGLHRIVAPGSTLTLSAVDSWDPDGDTLRYHWWVYYEAGTFSMPMELRSSNEATQKIVVPQGIQPDQTIHVICSVSDNGKPSLTRYARVVLQAQN